VLKTLSIIGFVLFALLFCYLAYRESTVWPRGSWTRTTGAPEYVHERYQRSYFSVRDAQTLRRLHTEEAIALFGIVAGVVAAAYSSRKSQVGRARLSRADE
jgi:uncharacterized membrane protein